MNSLETERLKLRKFSGDDWKGLYEYLSQEAAVRTFAHAKRGAFATEYILQI
ncbi:MAG: hypothetical protein Q8936_22600 [Bacillota bacterium]|nr:hypothetical protein [Bacillota bacterium]